MNKKGQALVEFVAILPVFLMLIFCIVDFARIISTKNTLENKLSDAVLLYENDKTEEEIKKIIDNSSLEINYNNDYATITLNEKIKPITPGLNNLSSKIFNVKVKRIAKKDINEITTTQEVTVYED